MLNKAYLASSGGIETTPRFIIRYFGEGGGNAEPINKIAEAACLAAHCTKEELVITRHLSNDGKRHVEIQALYGNIPEVVCQGIARAVFKKGFNAIVVPCAEFVLWDKELEK